MLRVIREVSPTWVVGENVFGIVNWNGGLVFDEIHADLEREGYEVQAYVLPACGVDAPHKRDRVWFVAYSSEQRCDNRGDNRQERHIQANVGTATESESERRGRARLTDCDKSIITDTNNERQQERNIAGVTEESIQRNSLCDASPGWQNFPTQSPVCGGNDGVPDRLDGITFPKWRNESIKAYGNAIVPQVAFQIFKAINEFNKK